MMTQFTDAIILAPLGLNELIHCGLGDLKKF